jgi:hypothetical protein
VEIKNAGGRVLVSEVLKPGDKYVVPDGQDLLLTTGNAGGITVFRNGRKVGPVGNPAEVRRNIALTPESFPFANTTETAAPAIEASVPEPSPAPAQEAGQVEPTSPTVIIR